MSFWQNIMRVKSKIDLWVTLVIWVTLIVMGGSIFLVPPEERMLGYYVGVPMILFMLWIYFGTYYELCDEYLFCRSGPFFEKIKYEKVKSIRLSQNMLSSMALSKDRIEIRQHDKGYIRGTTFISPLNREEFIIELKARCQNLYKET